MPFPRYPGCYKRQHPGSNPSAPFNQKSLMQNNQKNKKTRSFLKWAGGKYSLIDTITDHLPTGSKLIEPFVGAGTVFLNTDYERYLLNDINADLINLFNELKNNADSLITDMRELFEPKYNTKESFYALPNSKS